MCPSFWAAAFSSSSSSPSSSSPRLKIQLFYYIKYLLFILICSQGALLFFPPPPPSPPPEPSHSKIPTVELVANGWWWKIMPNHFEILLVPDWVWTNRACNKLAATYQPHVRRKHPASSQWEQTCETWVFLCGRRSVGRYLGLQHITEPNRCKMGIWL